MKREKDQKQKQNPAPFLTHQKPHYIAFLKELCERLARQDEFSEVSAKPFLVETSSAYTHALIFTRTDGSVDSMAFDVDSWLERPMDDCVDQILSIISVAVG